MNNQNIRIFFLFSLLFYLSLQPAIAKSFTVNSDSTVTDNDTGLIWQQEEGDSMSWETALTYCEELSLAGSTNWRLPNVKELESLIDETKSGPALDTTSFPLVNSSEYWSSTFFSGNSTLAWYVNFNLGSVDAKGKSYSNNVRCVRNSQ